MNYVSFSRIEKYNQCSEYFRRFYVDETDTKPVTDTIATVNGNVVHDVLEEFYGDLVDRDVPVDILLDGYWRSRLVEDFMKPEQMARVDPYQPGGPPVPFLPALKAIAKDITWMHWRASEACTDPAVAIRDQYGKLYKKPTMTKVWEHAWKHLRLDERQAAVNAQAGKLNKLWAAVPLTSVYAESYMVLDGYKDTMSNLKILHLEMPISDEADSNTWVLIPGTNYYFKGYIDVVAEDEYGCHGIIDHKTSKMKYTKAKVAHWDQMILYAWAYYELTGRWVDFIGINALRSKVLVTADFEQRLVEPALDRLRAAIRGADNRVFVPQSPTAYGSRCYDEWKEQDKACPYLGKCHPEFAKKVGVLVTP